MIRLLIQIVIGLLAVAPTFAGTCWNGGSSGSSPWSVLDGSGGSPSVAYADVNYCVNTVASEDDTVNVPAGTETWASQLLITKGIVLVGAGIGSTVITESSTDHAIQYDPDTPADDPTVDISGFTIDGDLNGGGILIECEDLTYPCYNFRIHNNRIIDGTTGIGTSGMCFGLVDNNQLDNNYYDFTLLGANSHASAPTWDNFYGLQYSGSIHNMYVEDNTSTNNRHMIINSGEGMRWVYRYNTTDTTFAAGGLDAHGNTQNRGVVGYEAYENDFDGATAGTMMDSRGGTGFVFNNTYGTATSGTKFQVREEDCGRDNDDADDYTCDYPGIDPVENTYFWNNRKPDYSNNKMGINLLISGTPNEDLLLENRDWWDDTVGVDNTESPLNFTYDVAASRPGTCADDDSYWETDDRQLYRCDGVNNWILVYEPYTYPHPLQNQTSRFTQSGTSVFEQSGNTTFTQ